MKKQQEFCGKSHRVILHKKAARKHKNVLFMTSRKKDGPKPALFPTVPAKEKLK